MTTLSSVKNQSGTTVQVQYTTDSVISKDGTNIGYLQLGHGPGLVVLHGMMSSAQTHIQLAQALAADFTVYLPDRRGRGRSGSYGVNYSIQREVEDLDALLTKTETHNVFGVSAGSIICLQAALTLPAMHKLAIYEPPLMVNGSISTDWLPRYDRQIAEGKVAAALVTGMKGSQLGPAILSLVPNGLLEPLLKMQLASEDKRVGRDEVPWRALAPTLHYDVQLAIEMSARLNSFSAIRSEMLLLGGSKSPHYLKVALDALGKVLPQVQRVELPGLGHAAPCNRNQRGQPEVVAQELRRFFM